MKGIVILLLVVGASYAAYEFFAPKDWDTEFKKNPQAALERFAEEANLERGKAVGEGRAEISLENASAQSGNLLNLNYRFSHLGTNDLSVKRIAEAQPFFVQMVCATKGVDLLLRHQVMIKTTVRARDGDVLFVQRVTRDKCSAAVREAAESPVQDPGARARMKCRNLQQDREAMEACIKHNS